MLRRAFAVLLLLVLLPGCASITTVRVNGYQVEVYEFTEIRIPAGVAARIDLDAGLIDVTGSAAIEIDGRALHYADGTVRFNGREYRPLQGDAIRIEDDGTVVQTPADGATALPATPREPDEPEPSGS